MDKPPSSSLPDAPGVYLYKDKQGTVIYVGKAGVLRKRILSYFREDGLSAKTQVMLCHATTLDFVVTTTEKEALLLEARLIKQYRPRYNIALRDDKQYCLFRLNLQEDYPRLEIVHRAKMDKALYFGPFPSALSARETWKILQQAFLLRRCTNRAMHNRVRPCLYYSMGQCPAPCLSLASAQEYRLRIQQLCALLKGNADKLLKKLTEEMQTAADNLDYERAAVLRDRIKAIRQTLEKQAVVLPGKTDTDVLALDAGNKGLALTVLFVRNGGVTESQNFYWAGLTLEDASEVLASFIVQYYEHALPPARLLLSLAPSAPDRTALAEFLTERRNAPVRLSLAHKTTDKQLLQMAVKNARAQASQQETQLKTDFLSQLAQSLHLPTVPMRIECVDISHTSGLQTRAGLVVYVQGVPCRTEYRVYAMPDSADDLNTLYAWTNRRLASGPPWPDLLLIDGGRGQVAAVERALVEHGQANLFALAGIAKARDAQGRADRRAGNVADRIFLAGRANPLPLRAGCAELLFLQQIRDAAHRFALTRHRQARSKATISAT